MHYCKNCQKQVNSKKELHHDFCFDCYKKFLYDKIEHLDDPNYVDPLKKENKFISFLKNLFKK